MSNKDDGHIALCQGGYNDPCFSNRQDAVVRIKVTVHPIAPETSTRILCNDCADWLIKQPETVTHWKKRV